MRMVTESALLRGLAISIERVMAQVRAWGYPVQLKKASIPHLGAVTERVASGPVVLWHQVFSVLSVHAGALRLTGDRLGVTAGMAGLGLGLREVASRRTVRRGRAGPYRGPV